MRLIQLLTKTNQQLALNLIRFYPTHGFNYKPWTEEVKRHLVESLSHRKPWKSLFSLSVCDFAVMQTVLLNATKGISLHTLTKCDLYTKLPVFAFWIDETERTCKVAEWGYKTLFCTFYWTYWKSLSGDVEGNHMLRVWLIWNRFSGTHFLTFLFLCTLWQKM